MKNPFDARVFSLSKSGFTKISRPIEFVPQITMSESQGARRQFFVGNVSYKNDEKPSILFLSAIKYEDWIFTLERSLLKKNASAIMICAFHKGESHCNFGPTTTNNPMGEFFDFFHEKILEDV